MCSSDPLVSTLVAIAIAIATIVVLVGVGSSKLLQGGEMSLTLFPGSLAILHDDRKQLSSGGFWRWWWCRVLVVASVRHPGIDTI